MYTTGSVIFISLILYIIQGVIFGVAVNAIIANKGYHENWFVWGFFFGFVALIVALSKPQKPYEPMRENPLLRRSDEQQGVNSGRWKCVFCNSTNANNVTTCSCGKSREDTQKKIKEAQKGTRPEAEKKDGSSVVQDELHIVEIISQYKSLLDSGAITQEEFDRKKQSLLQK